MMIVSFVPLVPPSYDVTRSLLRAIDDAKSVSLPKAASRWPCLFPLWIIAL